MHKHIPIVIGPTAAGKTGVAIALAQLLDGELIIADARTVYRGMDIGTAKPSAEERRQAPHHLIDICDATEVYDAQRFRQDVARLIPEIEARGRRPIVVGGSTLYVHALIVGLFEGVGADRKLRRELDALPLERVYGRLQAADPTAAAKLQPNDRIRITRALEVYELTGIPISQLQPQAQPLPHVFKRFGLTMDRDRLYARIDRRVEEMVEQGLVAEALRLHGTLTPEMPAYKTIGYQELFEHFDGHRSLEDAISKIKQHTRNYAKRQLTWHRRDPEIVWIEAGERPPEGLAAQIAKSLEFDTI